MAKIVLHKSSSSFFCLPLSFNTVVGKYIIFTFTLYSSHTRQTLKWTRDKKKKNRKSVYEKEEKIVSRKKKGDVAARKHQKEKRNKFSFN